MKTTYKVVSVESKYTVIHEYWDDLLIYKYTVFDSYKGGNIVQFIRDNDLCRTVNFDGLNEFIRCSAMLEF
jgi:hypothetical protein